MLTAEFERRLTEALETEGCYRAALPAIVRLLARADRRYDHRLTPEAAAALAVDLDRALTAALGLAAVRH